jgi:RNA polymerase-binding protein DksA
MNKVAVAKSVSKSATAIPSTAVLSAPKKGAKGKSPEVVVKKERAPILPPHRPAVVAAPVPTNGKPRKNQAGLVAKELEHYRELLLLKRRELVGDMSSMEREALRSTGTNLSNLPLHMADQGTDNYEQEFTLGLVEKDRQLLREINTALAKIMDGSYGICEGTGKPISKPRLEAQPWARFSIEHARAMEKGMLRR